MFVYYKSKTLLERFTKSRRTTQWEEVRAASWAVPLVAQQRSGPRPGSLIEKSVGMVFT